jgi:hypothetical protein
MSLARGETGLTPYVTSHPPGPRGKRGKKKPGVYEGFTSNIRAVQERYRRCTRCARAFQRLTRTARRR